MSKLGDMKVNIHTERVGKEFHIKAENPFGEPVTTVIDIQKAAGLSDEQTAELVARLDAKEKSKGE